jgi:hypothetical protein
VHFQKCGEIVGFSKDPKNPVRIWFGREFDSFVPYIGRRPGPKNAINPPNEKEQTEDLRTWDYTPNEIKKVDGWPAKQIIDRHFSGYHTWYEPKHKFVPGAEECVVQNCSQKTEARTYVNIWGSVYPVDICAKHNKEYGFTTIEDFPWKKKEETVSS